MYESDLEMRNRLSAIWRTLITRLDGSEFSAEMIYETLADVAVEGMVKEHGVDGALHRLRLKADVIETAERGHLAELMAGKSAIVSDLRDLRGAPRSTSDATIPTAASAKG